MMESNIGLLISGTFLLFGIALSIGKYLSENTNKQIKFKKH